MSIWKIVVAIWAKGGGICVLWTSLVVVVFCFVFFCLLLFLFFEKK